MRGHILKRGNTYSLVVDIGRDPETGRRRQKWYSVGPRKKEAERRAAEILVELNRGPYVEPTTLTVAEFLGKWLTDYVDTQVRPRTAVGYRYVIESHLIPSLGQVKVSDLAASDIQAYHARKLKNGRVDGTGGLSAQSVKHHHRILSEALNQGVKWGMLNRNVAKMVNPPRVERKEMRTLDESDVQRILDVARWTPYYTAIQMALYSGLRRSEMFGLQWGDIDLERRTLSVVRVLGRLKGVGYVYSEPKNNSSRRQVPFGESTELTLRQERERQVLCAQEMGRDVMGTDPVLAFPDGTPLKLDGLTHAWKRIAKKAGIEGVTLHGARHSHATLLLKAGTHPKVVQERLGHASIMTTLDLYSHTVPGMQEQAVADLERAIEKAR
jgi:integrase